VIYHPLQNSVAQFRVLGYARNLEHPEKSIAVLANGSGLLRHRLQGSRQS
jgi:hypothetical protein